MMAVSPATPATLSRPEDAGHRFDAGRRWVASLDLGFAARDTVTCLSRTRHRGPLRVQRPFYPEGRREAACHVYLLHPPGGVVSGDALNIDVEVGRGTRALLTTPAANKLYRADSQGVPWRQHTRLEVADDGVLEWLPQETIAFDGSRGEQVTTIELTGNARCLGWEILALGRPASDLPFASGHLEQRFHLTREGRPLWLERQPLDPSHPRFHGRWGQGGAAVQASLWAAGFSEEDAAEAVAALRDEVSGSPRWAVTTRNGVLLLRYLGNARNEAWDLCRRARDVLRPRLVGRKAQEPRIWRT